MTNEELVIDHDRYLMNPPPSPWTSTPAECARFERSRELSKSATISVMRAALENVQRKLRRGEEFGKADLNEIEVAIAKGRRRV